MGYNQGRKVFESRGALGEHTEVFNAEMAGLHKAATEATSAKSVTRLFSVLMVVTLSTSITEMTKFK